MQNVTYTVEGNKLVITVDISQRQGPSASGKTTIIATTAGNATLPGAAGIKFGLNVYTPNR